jgi:hypothetical protein
MEIVAKHYRSDEGLKIHEDEFDQRDSSRNITRHYIRVLGVFSFQPIASSV